MGGNRETQYEAPGGYQAPLAGNGGPGNGGDTLPAGFALGSYVIQSVLGCGGFGITYLARHTDLNKLYAVKEHFPRQFACRDGRTVRPTMRSEQTYEWGLRRFLEEGRKLAMFDHPAIVDVVDIFEKHGTAYMVLRYEPGDDFSVWLKSLGRPPTQPELDRIAFPLLDAVGHIHNKGMLHRDIAPDNIRIRADGTPVLIDFGSAREDIRRQSQLMSAIVKFGFSPPEQYATDSTFQGPWSDIYALGATLYLAVTGQPPVEAAERKISDSQVAAVKAAKGQFRSTFLQAIDWALALELRERPQDIASWRNRLLQGGTPPSERRSSQEANSQGRAAFQHHNTGPRTDSRPGSRPGRHRGASALLAVAAGAAFVLLGSVYKPELSRFAEANLSSSSLPRAHTPVNTSPTPSPDETRQRDNDAERRSELDRLKREAAEQQLKIEGLKAENQKRELQRAEDDARRQRQADEDASRQRADDDARRQRADDDARRQRADDDARRQRDFAAQAEKDRAQAEQRRIAEDRRLAEQRERDQQQAMNVPFAPSFNCAKDFGDDEIAICGNRELARLDVTLDGLYQSLKRRLSNSEFGVLKGEQRKWLQARKACGSDEVCLQALYVSRVQRLQNW